jgi:hypothetical protein
VLGGAALDAALERVVSRPLHATYFRAVPLKHVGDPFGRNRPIADQRFNVARGARVLYLGDSQLTCLYEVQAFGFPARTVAILPVRLQLNAVVDLRDPATCRALGLTQTELTFNFRALPPGAPPAPTQLLGERCAASGRIDGLAFTSLAYKTGADVAVFEAGLPALGSFLEVDDPATGARLRLP